ncbi:hypothetical protein [Nocardia concava]|uniref:hypothetical protein n=1 Tax=Nocardia concava TaxID=257281 RepID=UPI0005934E69|nr:hypothetical protein [Nocardia concava]
MPPLPAPNATVVWSANTAWVLTRAANAVLDAVPRWRALAGWVAVAACCSLPIGFLVLTWGPIGAAIWTAPIVLSIFLAWRRRPSRFDRQFARISRELPPGTVQMIRFGPDACDVRHDDYQQARIRYADVTELRVTPSIVVLMRDGDDEAHVYPRELFPDSAIHAIKAVAPALGGHPEAARQSIFPALPPCPPLDEPTGVLVIDETTAAWWARARRRIRMRSMTKTLLLCALPYLLLLWLVRGRTEVLVTCAVLALLWLTLAMRLWRQSRTHRAVLASSYPPGTSISIRLGPDSFDLQIGSDRGRFDYSTFRRLKVSHGLVLLDGTVHNTLPEKLFAPGVPDYLGSYANHSA